MGGAELGYTGCPSGKTETLSVSLISKGKFTIVFSAHLYIIFLVSIDKISNLITHFGDFDDAVYIYNHQLCFVHFYEAITTFSCGQSWILWTDHFDQDHICLHHIILLIIRFGFILGIHLEVDEGIDGRVGHCQPRRYTWHWSLIEIDNNWPKEKDIANLEDTREIDHW